MRTEIDNPDDRVRAAAACLTMPTTLSVEMDQWLTDRWIPQPAAAKPEDKRGPWTIMSEDYGYNP